MRWWWWGQCPSGNVSNTLILAMCRDSHGSHAAVLCQAAASSLQPVPRSIPGGGRGWWLVAALQWLGNLGFWSTAKPRRVQSAITPCPVPPPRPSTCDSQPRPAPAQGLQVVSRSRSPAPIYSAARLWHAQHSPAQAHLVVKVGCSNLATNP